MLSLTSAFHTLLHYQFLSTSTALLIMNTICKVVSLDHLVLTVKDITASINFYTKVLGMTSVKFGAEGRQALQFGNQKINLHEVTKEFKPHAQLPTSGSADLCFVSQQPLSQWSEHMKKQGIDVIEGPVKRTGAVGPMNSIYVRDPDGNLVEIAYYDHNTG